MTFICYAFPLLQGEIRYHEPFFLSLNAAIRFHPFSLFSRSVELLMEELAVDPACNGDAAGLSQLFVQLTDELIRIRNRYAKLFRNFIYSHKNFSCHRQNTFLSWFVVDCFAVLSAGLWQATLFGAVPFSFLLGTLISSPASPEKVSLGRSFSFAIFGFYPPHFTTDIFSVFVDYPNCKISMN